MSIIDKETIRVYREADYRVEGTAPMLLRVDVPSAALLALYRSSNCRSSAFITACNPLGERIDDAQNTRLQKQLADELNRLDCVFIEAIGEDAEHRWKGEPSFLVLGCSLAEAKAFGLRYRQNAVLWANEDATPRLVLLR